MDDSRLLAAAQDVIDPHSKQVGELGELRDVRHGFAGITYLKILVSFNQFCR